MVSVPVNLPFTRIYGGLKARKKLVTMLQHLLREKKEAQSKANPDDHKDLITLLLRIRYDGSRAMSDEEIIDNIILVMVAGYDTTSVLLTFLVRLLANQESIIYLNVAREQEEIAKNEALTWRVASKMLRMNPPVILTFRRAAQDIKYAGYIIPKGWQVMLSASMTHMDDSIFQNPTMFDPTRFERNDPSPPPFSLVAFGAGPRMCPGMEFAKMDTLARIW